MRSDIIETETTLEIDVPVQMKLSISVTEADEKVVLSKIQLTFVLIYSFNIGLFGTWALTSTSIIPIMVLVISLIQLPMQIILYLEPIHKLKLAKTLSRINEEGWPKEEVMDVIEHAYYESLKSKEINYKKMQSIIGRHFGVE